MLIITTTGQNILLGWALQATATPENLILKLYSNAYTPVAASIATNFTEATFTGYSSKTLSRASWATPSTQLDGSSQTTYATQSWTVGSGQTIQGYYVVGATSGSLIWAQQFDTARVLTTGDVFTLTPSFSLGQS